MCCIQTRYNMLNDLKQGIEYLETMLTSLREEIEPLVAQNESVEFSNKVEFYYLLRQLKEISEEYSKLANIGMPIVAQSINRHMQQLDMESMDRTFNGVTYRLKPNIRYFISYNKDQRPQVIEWMKGDPIGRELVKEDVHPKTFESFVKQRIEEGKEPPPHVQIHAEEVLDFRKLPKK